MSRKPGSAPSLTQDQIAQCALDLMMSNGPEKLSIRALATELGVGAMTLYTYYPSKEAIVESAKALIRAQYDNEPIPGEYWEDTLFRTASSIRSVALKYDKAYVNERGNTKHAEEHSRRVYQIYKDQGMPIRVYRPFWSAVEAYLSGFIGHEIAQANTVPAPIDPNDPDKEWLAIAQNAYTEESFRQGIDLIIKGTRLLAAPDPCEWRTPEDPAEWTWGKSPLQ